MANNIAMHARLYFSQKNLYNYLNADIWIRNNFVIFTPHKKFTSIRIRLAQIDQWNEALEQSGLDYDYRPREGRYRIRMEPDQFKPNVILLEQLLQASFTE